MIDIESALRRLAVPAPDARPDGERPNGERLTELARVGLLAADELARLRTENDGLRHQLAEARNSLREAFSEMS